MPSTQDLAAQWLALDRDPETRAEVQALLAATDTAELDRRLRGRIAFGTAGLRGRMEAGYTRMNCVTVIQASQGLAAYLAASPPAPAAPQRIVVGRDARANSDLFARLAAGVFLARGFEVCWLGPPVHTPLVPFAVRACGAAAGVMVTASHNPARDNGYKVYYANGCQIVPPHDAGIAAAIARSLTPLTWDAAAVDGQGRVVKCFDEVCGLYYQALRGGLESVSDAESEGGVDANGESVPFVYTPLHGVGLAYMQRALDVLNGQTKPSHITWQMHVVPQQAEPDPAFPTLKFPNPEEAGALKLAMEAADAQRIDLIVSTDPDADRLAAAERNADGHWHQFTGNQLGVLLASRVLEWPKYRDRASTSRSNMAMLCSTVSTSMLRIMAEAEGFHFVETLTGFKWLGSVAQDLIRERGWDVPFAFEEAIGYMFSASAFDKDGVAAALFLLDAAAAWRRADALSLHGKLQQLYARYGFFADANTYLLSPSADITDAVFANIRAAHGPSTGSSGFGSVGGRRITRWRDLTMGFDSATADNVPALPSDAASQMITCEVEHGRGTRFTVRASGTEPKIKLYVESRAASADEAQLLAGHMRDALVEEWFTPKRYGLTLP